MSLRRIALALLLALTAVAATATPALAHTDFTGSDPAEGAILPAAPQQVTLSFSEPVTVAAGGITVTGPGGVAWGIGTPAVQGSKVVVPVRPTGPAGGYTIGYSVAAEDGHPLKGAVHFILNAPVTPPTTTAAPTTAAATTAAAAPTGAAVTSTAAAPAEAASDGSGGLPWWGWVLIVVGALAVVGGLVAARRRGAGRQG